MQFHVGVSCGRNQKLVQYLGLGMGASLGVPVVGLGGADEGE